MPDKIRIFDTTLRDGEQSPGCSMNLEEKMKMARQLERLNVDIIEAGFPIASEGDFLAVQAIPVRFENPRSPAWRGPTSWTSSEPGRPSRTPKSRASTPLLPPRTSTCSSSCG